MKKILTSFLLMAIIAGCVQQGPTEAEKPEEPPVVEQPEKPVEQEKPEETKYVKKIDETKDWVYINDIHTSNMDFAYLNMKQAILDLEFTSGNELENWFNTIVTYNPEIQDFMINIDSHDAAEINSMIQEQVQLRLRDPKTKGEHVFKVKSFENDEFLSIIVRSGLFLPSVGSQSEAYIYNFDLLTGESLTNDELLKKLGLSYLQLGKILDDYFKKNEQIACNEEIDHVSCYDWQDFYGDNINSNYIFIADNQLNILWRYCDEQGKYYYRQITME